MTTENQTQWKLVPVEPDDAMAQVLENSLIVTSKGSFLNAKSALAKAIAAAPQPPALGGWPEVIGYFYAGDIMGDQFNRVCLRHYYRKPGAGENEYIQPEALIRQTDHIAHVARLQAEVERQKAELEATEKLYEEGCQATYDFDSMQQQIEDLRGMLRMAWGSDDISAEDCRRIDAALNKTEGQNNG